MVAEKAAQAIANGDLRKPTRKLRRSSPFLAGGAAGLAGIAGLGGAAGAGGAAAAGAAGCGAGGTGPGIATVPSESATCQVAGVQTARSGDGMVKKVRA